ncbi:helix-turn-helix domain-containing protein [Vagococcus zengguangii]|uniref:Uncharacterized protein n=1 Tax=Vagococcus zengguangii TaxID=2571750 RepID=A0A4D7CU24_9ENTE|nr:helix-turn-helix domain-containing protein [Vagococcus zengguangii]QCI85887.1 hypothetical protein FA707_02410 [Vagococcus zengguangii]TLG81827.1 hypothetical protein FE258_01390 [Vagococcus zengguangii]
MIDKLLSKRDQEKYLIIKFIQQKGYNYITEEEVAETTGLSLKKIRNLTEQIKEDSKAIYGETNELHKALQIKNRTYHKSLEYNPYNYFKFYLSNTLACQWLIKMYLEEDIILESDAKGNRMTLSTIYRKWHTFQETMLSFNLKIVKTKQHLYRLDGDETTIRYIYYYIFMLLDYPVSISSECEKLIFEPFYKAPLSSREGELASVKIMLLITLNRAKNYPINPDNRHDFSIIQLIHSKDQFIEMFNTTSIKEQIPESDLNQELDFLYFFLNVENTYSYVTFDSETIGIFPFAENKYIQITNDIYVYIYEKFDIQLNTNQLFSFYLNCYFAIRKREVFNSIVDFKLSEAISRDYELFKKQIGDYQFEKHLSLKQLYIIIQPFLFQTKKQIKILVINRNGEAVIETIEQMIKKSADFEPLFVKRISQKPDVIVTDGQTFGAKDIPTVCLSQIPNKVEIFEFIQTIENLL